MVPKDAITCLGSPPFHTTSLISDGILSYIGGTWSQDVAFAGFSVPLTGDFPAGRMINSIGKIDPARKAKLLEVLDINEEWRMHLAHIICESIGIFISEEKMLLARGEALEHDLGIISR